MVRVSGLSLLMLLVLCHAVGSAVGKTFVTTSGESISIPMKECNNAKRWYKDGKYISGLSFDHQNRLYFANPTLSQSGTYTCGKNSPAELVVVEIDPKRTFIDTSGHQIKSILNVSENFELGCSISYIKHSSMKQLPLRIIWKTFGQEKNENIATEKMVQEENPGNRTSVTLTSWLNFTVENARPDVVLRCQAIDEEGKVFKTNSIHVHLLSETNLSSTIETTLAPSMLNTEMIAPFILNQTGLNPNELRLLELNSSESISSELNSSPSDASQLEPSKSLLLIILPSVFVVLLVAGVGIFVLIKRYKDSQNVILGRIV